MISPANHVIINCPGENGLLSYTLNVSEFTEFRINLPESARLSFDGMVFGWPQFSIGVSMLGGKGGFGSLLRSQKNIGKKTDNFDSTRDLTGRRIRVAKKDEREDQLKAKREADDKLVAFLKADKVVAAPVSLDKKFIDALSRGRSENESALYEGLKQVIVSKPPKQMKHLDEY